MNPLAEWPSALRDPRRLAAAGCVVATFLAFPQRIGGFAFDAGICVAWCVPALLWVALDGLSPGRAALRAFGIGWLGHAAVLHWFDVVVHTYGHAPRLLGLAAPFGAALYIAVILGAFGWVWAHAGRLGARGPIVFAALWVLADYARTTLFGGFPWALLAYAQYTNPLLMALAPWTGMWGIGFATACVGGWFGRWALAWPTGARPGRVDCAAPAAVAGACLLAFGIGAALPPETSGSLRIAALQGNLDQGAKWDRARFDETLDIYLELSAHAVAEGAELVVWPETAVPGPFALEPEARARVEAMVASSSVPIVLGSVGVTQRPGGAIEAFHDSAFVLSPETPRVLRYDKTHLVPFGEYMPLRGLIGDWIGGLARGAAPLDVTAGDEPRALDVLLGGADGALEVVRVGVPICYELVFPDLVRRFVGDGGRVLLAITNDAWYGRTGAPDQFLAMTAMRSAEGRIWTVRAANTGVSAIIDARGRVRQRTAIFERGAIVADVPLLRAAAGALAADGAPAADGASVAHGHRRANSFYVRFGDYFVAICAAIFVGAFARAWQTGAGAAREDAQRHRVRGKGEHHE